MFETRRRPHPLQTFRFWLFVLMAGCFTLAWKLDYLPFRLGPAETGTLSDESVDEFHEIHQFLGKNEDSVTSDDNSTPLPFDQAAEPLDVPPLATTTRQTALVEPPGQSEPHPLLVEQSEPAESFDFKSSAELMDEPSPSIANNSPTSAAVNDAWLSDFDNDDWPIGDESAAQDSMVRHESDVIQADRSWDDPGEPTTGSIQQTAAAFDFSQDVEPPPSATPRVDLTKIDQLIEAGTPADEIEAHRLLSTIYWQQPEARSQIRERIDSLAQRIYFLNSRHYMDAYQVQEGDLLQSIARQYDVSWQYLSRLNRVDPKRVRVGERLKVIKGPFSVIVDLSDHEVTVHAHGYFVTRYPVGVGKDGASPIGEFTVQEKLTDPTYYGPNGIIAHDDPSNPLGEHWIDIGDSYGLHGTIDPTSIGKDESRGCIRLHNDDVAALYDLLTIGSPVTIRP